VTEATSTLFDEQEHLRQHTMPWHSTTCGSKAVGATDDKTYTLAAAEVKHMWLCPHCSNASHEEQLVPLGSMGARAPAATEAKLVGVCRWQSNFGFPKVVFKGEG